jgi:hypothetical protein
MSSSSAPVRPQKGDPTEAAASMDRYRRSGSIDDLANVFKNKFV